MQLLGSQNHIPVWGQPLQNAIDQMENAMKVGNVVGGALMADHHLGYSVPVGGVIAYDGQISPSGVGYDIGCGCKAVLTNINFHDIKDSMNSIMDDVVRNISFGIGRVSKSRHIAGQVCPTDHPLFDSPAWEIPAVKPLKEMARQQLGTVGSGNHYVDVFTDEHDRVWIGCHFGSRGLGHKIATHYIKEGGGSDGINVDPVVFDAESEIGAEYISAMELAGAYAYAGRDWVCDEVTRILGGKILDSVHNHHNFAWKESHHIGDLWVVRKGATPAFTGQRGFVGGTMGENSVILEGGCSPFEGSLAEQLMGYSSTVHGAGRVMSRTQAAGKSKWKKGVKTKISDGAVSQTMMDEWVKDRAKVVLRGGGVDESPHCYKRLSEVLNEHHKTIRVLNILTPLGVAMAGDDIVDPYKD